MWSVEPILRVAPLITVIAWSLSGFMLMVIAVELFRARRPSRLFDSTLSMVAVPAPATSRPQSRVVSREPREMRRRVYPPRRRGRRVMTRPRGARRVIRVQKGPRS
jgi:hypothetical protein